MGRFRFRVSTYLVLTLFCVFFPQFLQGAAEIINCIQTSHSRLFINFHLHNSTSRSFSILQYKTCAFGRMSFNNLINNHLTVD